MQRHLRLRRSEDFARVRAVGQVWRHSLLILSMTPNHLPHNRYGFVTSRQLGKAAVRNRVRRRLREVVRHAHADLVQGYDIVLVARNPVVGQPYTRVSEAVLMCLRRAGLWKPPVETQPA